MTIRDNSARMNGSADAGKSSIERGFMAKCVPGPVVHSITAYVPVITSPLGAYRLPSHVDCASASFTPSTWSWRTAQLSIGLYPLGARLGPWGLGPDPCPFFEWT
jgi:hypothetical protein